MSQKLSAAIRKLSAVKQVESWQYLRALEVIQLGSAHKQAWDSEHANSSR
jgi:hypothetical protein